MTRKLADYRRVALAVALVSAAPSAALFAQGTADEGQDRWAIGSVSAAWCVHFLVEPSEAQDDLTRGFRTLAAREAASVPAQLRRVIADEPQYADWVPAQLCVAFPSEVSAQKRQYNRGDGGKPLALLWWGVAAAGDGFGPELGGLSLRLLATNSSGLKRLMELERVRMERITIDRAPVKESQDERVRIKVDNVEIVFDGHPRPDSTLTVQALHQTAAVTGDLRIVWIVETNLEATSVAALSGALRIQGKGGIAKLLNQSPIRLLGTMLAGSGGEVVFRRQP